MPMPILIRSYIKVSATYIKVSTKHSKRSAPKEEETDKANQGVT